MFDLFLLTLLVGGKNQAPAFLAQVRRAAGLDIEMLDAELAPVEQVQCEPIGHDRSQLLHEIEREGGPTRPKAVQIADLRIEPDSF
jgi:hypothetical protein